MRNNDVERAAETQFFIRNLIVKALRDQKLLPDAKQRVGDYDNYFDMWKAGFGDRFFDMATLIRLGTGIENGLRAFHLSFGSHTTNRGFYQRIVQHQHSDELADRLLLDCSYDVRTNAQWNRVREIMLHRHLYAHRTGLVDNKYIDDLKVLTGSDIRPDVQKLGYPKDEVYWFRPLTNLNTYIEDARKFFYALPDALATP